MASDVDVWSPSLVHTTAAILASFIVRNKSESEISLHSSPSFGSDATKRRQTIY